MLLHKMERHSLERQDSMLEKHVLSEISWYFVQLLTAEPVAFLSLTAPSWAITCLRYSYRLTLIGFLSRHLIILDTQPCKMAIRHPFCLQPNSKGYVLLYTTGNVMAMHIDMQSPMVVEKLEPMWRRRTLQYPRIVAIWRCQWLALTVAEISEGPTCTWPLTLRSIRRNVFLPFDSVARTN